MHAPESGTVPHSAFRTWLHRLLPALGLVLFALAIWTLHSQLKKHPVHAIVAAFHDIPTTGIVVAAVFTVVGYFILTGYDFLAMRYINHDLHYRRVALAAFIGYAFSNSIGHSFLTGGTVRYRLYTVWGVSGLDVARVIAFSHLAFYLGMLVLIGQGCVLEPGPVSREVLLPQIVVQIVGVAMLATVAVYMTWTIRRRHPLRIIKLHFAIPSIGLSLAQLVIASLDMALVAAVLWALLPGDIGMSFAGFLGLFIIAQVIGVGSQVPGGLGVFETIMLHVLSPQIDAPVVLATLVVYRVMYFLIPLVIAAAMLGVYELRTHQRLLITRRKGGGAPPAQP